jgi:uncharacterized sulfatase
MLLGLFLASGPALTAEPPRPNLVLILADDLGYGDLGCFGSQRIQTPNLDRMAAEGMKLTDFYAGCTVCAPSRCVLMTGRHSGRAAVRGNAGQGRDAARQSLPAGSVTVASVLQQAGYATAMFGKWGLGELGSPGHPLKQGFDTFYGYLNQTHAHNYYPEFLISDHDTVPLRNRTARAWLDSPKAAKAPKGSGWAEPGERVDYSHDLIFTRALEWLEQHHDRPFFLYLPFTLPHANNEASAGTGNGQEIPDHGLYADRDWPEPDKGQAAMVSRLDRDVGTLLRKLTGYGIDRRTLVLFSSDNGPHREGGNRPDFFQASGPFQGTKRSLHEGGIRVPTLAWWPGHIAPGSSSAHPAYFGDLLATACDLAKLPVPSDLDSLSFLPTLTGKGNQAAHRWLYWEFHEQGTRQAVRFGNWKAIREPMPNGPIRLYDLHNDPAERTDLAATLPEKTREAARLLDEAHQPHPLWPIPGE